ncbi:MAG: hypothetical protein LBG08_08605, partial [Spirochaetaceae bacterium]|nr:hypothetical protein [Spirochaetaceae bacterium]
NPETDDHTDVWFSFSLKTIPNVTLALDSKIENLNDSDAKPLSNTTGFLAGYKFNDKLAAQATVQVGAGDLTCWLDIGARRINKDQNFAFAVKPQVSYVISDALKFTFDTWFSVPESKTAGDFNLRFNPWLQWTVAPGAFGPAAQVQFRYFLDVYNDGNRVDSAKVKNNNEAIAHQFAIELAVSF